MIGSALLFQGDAETALQTLLLEEDEAFSAPSLAMAYHALERFAESDEALARAIEADSEPVAIAQAYAYRSDADSALDWLRRGFESGRDNDTGDPSLDPAWGSLVDDPRWQSLLTEYGFATDQLAAMEFRISVPQ
jgi:tetratricopeptide (TPR) repeat protein